MQLWDPDRYLAHADQRSRPWFDLLARITSEPAPQEVMDLGCGPGTLTVSLAERWPEARVRGLDASPDMVASARERPGIDVEQGDLRDWAEGPDQVDLLVSNATLQWVPQHLELLPRLLAHVRPGGVLAFQVPANFDEPVHVIRDQLAAEPPYAEHTAGAATPASHDPAVYLDVLARAGCVVDAWETTYLHLLHGEDPVFEWTSGTGARPTLRALPPALREAYEQELRARLRAAYPDPGYGVVLPYRRVFVVAQRAR